MNYNNYEKLKTIYLNTWEDLVYLMLQIKNIHTNCTVGDRLKLDVVKTTTVLDRCNVLKLYDMNNLIFEISYDTSQESLSTFTDSSIRIANWNTEIPRYYALYDPDNSTTIPDYTCIRFPFTEEYFFQRMTVQETLPEEDYEIWDTESLVQSSILQGTGIKSVAVVLRGNGFELYDYEILALIVPKLKELIEEENK